MAQDKATQTTPPGSPRPHTTAPVTSTICSIQPQNPTAIQACACSYPQSTGPMIATPRPAEPHPSTSISLHWSGHAATVVTTADQFTTLAAPQPFPQFMRSIWTAQEVTQLVQLRSQGLSWSEVSTHFLGKTANACRKRHERHTKSTLRHGPVIQD